nr:ImmA/IrrE family metallo-endopeptidase [Rothia dentocariosa]
MTVRRDSLVPSYDPYTHAHTLGVDIVWGTPGHGMLGRYDHASRTITLREGMRTRQERSVLAHELVHAVRGDEHDAWDASYSARRERSCDLLAAENLIDPGDLRRAAAFYPDNLPALAYELDVTEELLVIYLDAHPLTVAQA